MILLIHLVAAAIVVTKFFDCLTTQKHMTGLSWEANPVARKLMRWFGARRAIWLVFLVTVGVVGLSWSAVLAGVASDAGARRRWLAPVGFIVVGTFVSVVQGAVAHMNATRRSNRITDVAFDFFGAIERWRR